MKTVDEEPTNVKDSIGTPGGASDLYSTKYNGGKRNLEDISSN
jgi:hypothetical protein